MLLACLLLRFVGSVLGYGPQELASAPVCPPVCQCEQDGILVLVDCSELGLSAVPSDLHLLTSYLDLSMNNISELQPNAFHNLPFLEELRMSGNHLRHIPSLVFTGLHNLKVLMLQNNQLQRLPSETLWDLPNLQSLRLDANLISEVPEKAFAGLRSLRHLWLDDNALSEIPVRALNNLHTLQAMTLALNRISHIPDGAFRNLSSLVVLHLHNNRIQSLGQNCFEGLQSLETLDLNYNDLQEFPVAIRTLAKLQELGFHNNNIKAIPERAFVGNPLLQTIHFYENPIQFVGGSAFQDLPELHTLSLNGATEIKAFPDLKGTTSLEILTLTRAGLSSLPRSLCQQLPGLRVLELSHNQIEELPSFHRCQRLEEISLQHNQIREIRVTTFLQLAALRSLDLSWNRIEFIHPEAFGSLRSLVKLDLTDNQLTTLPLEGLSGLTHLKLKGNLALSEPFRVEDLPKMRVLEMPYAYQCCVYGACKTTFKPASQWDAEETGSEDEDVPKRTMGMFPSHTDNNYYLDMDDFQLDADDSKLHPNIQCSPSPGPFKPCDYLFDSWVIRLGVWAIALVSLICNSLLIVTVFASPSYLSPVKFVIGSIGGANLLTGLCTGALALVDALTFGEFSRHGARWESGPGCQAGGFLSVFASEASILFLTLAAVQCSISVSCVRAYGKSPSFRSVKAAALCCVGLSVAVAALPLFSVGEYGSSPLCLPSPLAESRPSTLGFMVALIMMNTLCFLVITGTYIKLYWDLMKGEFDSIWDCAMIKHVAWLIFTNCLLYCPVAFLTFSSLLSLFPISNEVIKSVSLVLLPLPACLNPLLYLLFNPHFKEDLRLLWRRPQSTHEESPDSFASEETEKSSYDSTQALVTFSDVKLVFEGAVLPRLESFGCPQSASVTLIPRQQRDPSWQEGDAYTAPHPCLTDEELLIASQSDDLPSSGHSIRFYQPPRPSHPIYKL
ncbi:leucine-rich repeat-containing G-protein coupled receptor 6-like [Acipenser ruthenus]|uniref:leucine-rich repeat-containing G-protein coupled receptor 6-like n=1 Tax=Acipenser ruthenus TaxID=7906 RepID=UPI0027424543|nr:leucine-rich repeat-containing G-protein coupled receptor 6-like [Acipenser ruthenus]